MGKAITMIATMNDMIISFLCDPNNRRKSAAPFFGVGCICIGRRYLIGSTNQVRKESDDHLAGGLSANDTSVRSLQLADRLCWQCVAA